MLGFHKQFYFHCYRVHRDLHSFPTRRSSDLCRLRRSRRARALHRSRLTPLSDTSASQTDRKSTRLNSSYPSISYAVFCLKKKKLLNLLLRIVAFLLFLNPQCLASISRWITASSSWKRFCLFVCRALSSIMVICMLTAIRLLLTVVMSLYRLLRS